MMQFSQSFLLNLFPNLLLRVSESRVLSATKRNIAMEIPVSKILWNNHIMLCCVLAVNSTQHAHRCLVRSIACVV